MSDLTLPELTLFVPIAKVDEDKRLVYGRIAAEVVDRSGEVLDYFASKPYFEKWSQGFVDATGGRSKGNLRAMHKGVSAGKFTEIVFDDDKREILGVAKVVDDNEWEKVLEGVYTGFSIGGRYASRTPDTLGKGKTRYVAQPGEVSLVDTPCLPIATFEVVKADGSVLDKAFRPWQPGNDEVALCARDLAAAKGGDANWVEFVAEARDVLIAKRTAAAVAAEEEPTQQQPSPEPGLEKPALAKADEPSAAEVGVTQQWTAPDGRVFLSKTEAVAHALRAGNPVAQALAKATAVIDAPAEGSRFADPGFAPDGRRRFRLDSALDVRASWAHFVASGPTLGYSRDNLIKVSTALHEAWFQKVSERGPPPPEQMATVADIGLHRDALTALAKTARFFRPQNDGAVAGCTWGTLGPFSIVAQISHLAGDAVRLANNIGDAGDEMSPAAQHARDVVAAIATLLAEFTQDEVTRLLIEADVLDGADAEGGGFGFDPSNEAEKLAAAIVDLAKADDTVVDAVVEDRIQDIALYAGLWKAATGVELDIANKCAAPLPADVGAVLGKVADAIDTPFVAASIGRGADLAGLLDKFAAMRAELVREDAPAHVFKRFSADVISSLTDALSAAAHLDLAALCPALDVAAVTKRLREEADADSDAAAEFIEKAAGRSDDLAKRGARNNRADQQMIQQIHDFAARLGASCGLELEKSAPRDGDAVLQLVEDNTRLRKQIDEAVTGIQALSEGFAERLAKAEAEVAAMRNSPVPRTPSRMDPQNGGPASEDEIAEALRKRLEGMTPEQLQLEVLKLAQARPMQFVRTA